MSLHLTLCLLPLCLRVHYPFSSHLNFSLPYTWHFALPPPLLVLLPHPSEMISSCFGSVVLLWFIYCHLLFWFCIFLFLHCLCFQRPSSLFFLCFPFLPQLWLFPSTIDWIAMYDPYPLPEALIPHCQLEYFCLCCHLLRLSMVRTQSFFLIWLPA